MSAYIVADKTINRIVNRLAREVRDNPDSYALQRGLLELGYDLTDNSCAEKLAKDMLMLNVDAVRQRYQEEDPAPAFKYEPGIHASLIQTVKSLQCWLYQCTEGNIPENKLYMFFLGIFANYLLKRIVYDMPEYDQAEWA
jgi:hypothetical protein